MHCGDSGVMTANNAVDYRKDAAVQRWQSGIGYSRLTSINTSLKQVERVFVVGDRAMNLCARLAEREDAGEGQKRAQPRNDGDRDHQG